MRLIDATKLEARMELLRDGYNKNGNVYECAKYEAFDDAFDEVCDSPTIIPEKLTEADFMELRHRFGETVEYVVRKMCGKENE